MPSSTPRAAFWSEHLAAIDAAGITVADYAREHQLSAHSLYRWRRLLRRRVTEPHARSRPRFAELVPSAPPSPERGVSLRLAGVALEFDALPDPTWLAALLLAAERRR